MYAIRSYYVLAGVGLDRGRRTAVGVALAQHRVHRAAQQLGVAILEFLLGVGLGIFRVVRDGIALVLQFGDAGAQLRYRGADVRQLDDVGVGISYNFV